jgi:ribosomal protein S18 acetylase RimI-like enzyme
MKETGRTAGEPHSHRRHRPAPALQVFHCRDWRLVRRLRLLALETDPAAFLADADVERARVDEDWATETDELIWVTATVADDGVGLARSRKAEDGTHVESLWVEPGHRRSGVATRLMHELFRIERDHGVTQLFVWVLEGNGAARSLYRRLGFTPTRTTQLLGDGRTEVRFAIELGPGRPARVS